MEATRRARNPLTPYRFVAPALAVFCVFALGPIIAGLVLSTLDWDPIEDTCRWVGFANFQEIATSPNTRTALLNNLVWIVLSLGVQLPLALMLAAALSDASRSSRLLRTLFFSPLVIPAVAIGLLFEVMLDGRSGVLNALLTAAYGDTVTIGWLADRKYALPSLIGVACWQYTGFHMMVLLAGIQAIPKELYEAASLDGAGWWQRLTGVTIPLLKRVMLVDALLIAIGSIKIFDLVWIMTEGGPNNATDVLATHMYGTAFKSDQMGAGSAIAVLMLAITLTFALIHSRLAAKAGEQ